MANEVDLTKVSHINTSEEPEPCVLCKQPTSWRAVFSPLPLMQFRKALCKGCLGDGMTMARFLGRFFSTAKTGTRLGGGDQ